MIIRTNKKMDAYLNDLNFDIKKSSYFLTPELTNLIQADFIDNNDCITLKSVAGHSQNTLFKTSVEKCEWEYNETHFHPDWSAIGDKESEVEYLKTALECGQRLAKRVKSAYPDKNFRVVVSFSESIYVGQEV